MFLAFRQPNDLTVQIQSSRPGDHGDPTRPEGVAMDPKFGVVWGCLGLFGVVRGDYFGPFLVFMGPHLGHLGPHFGYSGPNFVQNAS